jgi:hypothetical protein
MNCSQCGHEALEGANACTNCGASLTGQPLTGTGVPASPGASSAPPGAGAPMPPGATPTMGGAGASQFAFDIKRLTTIEMIVGGASFVLLVSLFLPWLTFAGIVSVDGFDLHGYFWLVFLLCLAVIAFLVMKAGFATRPFQLPITDDQALLIATGISFVIVVLGFLFNGYSYVRAFVSSSYGFGAFLGLIASIVAFAPLAWPVIQKQMNKGST